MIDRIRPLLVVAAPLALAGCSDADAPKAQTADPVMVAALHAPLLADPDLSQFNARNLAIVPPGPALPPQTLPKTLLTPASTSAYGEP